VALLAVWGSSLESTETENNPSRARL